MRNDSNTSLVFRASEKKEGGVWGSTSDISLDTMVVKPIQLSFEFINTLSGKQRGKRNSDPWNLMTNSSISSEALEVSKLEKGKAFYWTE